MEWVIFSTIAAIVGFGITIMTPILKLNTSITKLTAFLDSVNEKVTEIDKDNKQSHGRIYDKLDKQDERIRQLEIRD